MKKLISISVLLLWAIIGNAQFSKGRLQATGLTCAMCSNAINKALQAVPFIASVKSDIKNSAFDIQFKENTSADPDAILKAVEDAGFGIGSLKLTGRFESLPVDHDQHVQIAGKNYHFLKINKQVLDGERTITFVEKRFLTSKEFKKYSSATKLKCFDSGKAEDCCTGVDAGERMFHVTI